MVTTMRSEVLKLRGAGLTAAEIGRTLGISRERVRQIVDGNSRLPRKSVAYSKVMLTVSEVAQLLNIHINTVRRWSDSGDLKTYRIGSRGDRRFLREDVESFLSGAMQGGGS